MNPSLSEAQSQLEKNSTAAELVIRETRRDKVVRFFDEGGIIMYLMRKLDKGNQARDINADQEG